MLIDPKSSMRDWQTATRTFASPAHPEACFDTADSATSGTVSILCVADGAGTHETAQLASRKAASLAMAVFLELAPQLNEQDSVADWQPALTVVHATAERFFEEMGVDPADYNAGFNTTLAVAVVKDDWISLAMVGDSFVVFSGHHGAEIVMMGTRPVGPSSSAAYMLGDWQKHTEHQVFWDPTVNCVLVSTDGLERLLRYRPVQQLSGERRQRLVGVSDLLADAVSVTEGQLSDKALSQLGTAAVIGIKSDDVGVAVAYRR